MISVGSPSAPENVSAAVVGVGVLNVSWSFKAMPGIEVDFTLTAMNLNNVEESMILMTQDLFEIVTSPDNMSCDAYQFRVTARNAAGNTSSGYISSTFLSQPVSPREDSIQHLLEKIAGGISLHVMINVIKKSVAFQVMLVASLNAGYHAMPSAELHIVCEGFNGRG